MILSSYPQPPQLHGLETIHHHNVERWPHSWWSSLKNSHHGGSAFIILNGFVTFSLFAILSAVSSLGAFYCEVTVVLARHRPVSSLFPACEEFIWLFRNHLGSGALLRQRLADCNHLFKNRVYVSFIVFIFLSSFLCLIIWTHPKIEVQTVMCRGKPDRLHCPGIEILTVKMRSLVKLAEKPLLLDPHCIVLSCAQLFFSLVEIFLCPLSSLF